MYITFKWINSILNELRFQNSERNKKPRDFQFRHTPIIVKTPKRGLGDSSENFENIQL